MTNPLDIYKEANDCFSNKEYRKALNLYQEFLKHPDAIGCPVGVAMERIQQCLVELSYSQSLKNDACECNKFKESPDPFKEAKRHELDARALASSGHKEQARYHFYAAIRMYTLLGHEFDIQNVCSVKDKCLALHKEIAKMDGYEI